MVTCIGGNLNKKTTERCSLHASTNGLLECGAEETPVTVRCCDRANPVFPESDSAMLPLSLYFCSSSSLLFLSGEGLISPYIELLGFHFRLFFPSVKATATGRRSRNSADNEEDLNLFPRSKSSYSSSDSCRQSSIWNND